MAVLDPLKVVIENYGDKGETLKSENLPNNEASGLRDVPFSREIYIERSDFMEDPPGKFYRLSPGREVRLKDAYIIKCEKVIKDNDGNITELRCSYDPDSKTGGPTAGRKIKGTLHWVDAATAVPCEARLYDYLLIEGTGDYLERMNKESLTLLKNAVIEKEGRKAAVGDRFQFMRQGYFRVDEDSEGGKLVFNRIVGLKDSYAKAIES